MKSHYGHHRLLLGAGVAPPPSPSNFDVNMVIILAALLCALICALGLNSIVRCALRYTRRVSTSEVVVVAAPRAVSVTRRGLRRSALRQIPVVVYGDDVEVMATECTICLVEFVDGEKVRVMPKCTHGFHVRCIDTWLVLHSSCPTCRRPVPEGGGGFVAVGVGVAGVVGAGVEHGEVVVGVGEADVG